MRTTLKFDGLDEFDRLEGLADLITELAIDELNQLGMAWVEDCRENTLPVSGDLKKSWKLKPVRHDGEKIDITVENLVSYAKHVEYGHRQEVGRYVPAIGKRLVRPFVKGQKILATGKKNAEEVLPDVIQKIRRRIEKRLNR